MELWTGAVAGVGASRLRSEGPGRWRAVGLGVLAAALVAAGALGCTRDACPVCPVRGGGGNGPDIQGEVVPPALGVVKVNELYLSPGEPPSTAFAEPVEVDGKTVSDPNRDGNFNTCDKFVEIVNVTDQPVDLTGVRIYAGAKSTALFKLGNVVVPAHGALLLFYGYKDCKGKAPVGLGPDIVIAEWPEYQFVTADSNNPVRLESADGVELDRLYYPKPKEGVSVVRSHEVDGGDPAVMSGDAVDHRAHPCAQAMEKDGKIVHLAVSPGTCVDGSPFSATPPCACSPSGGGDVVEAVEPDEDAVETTEPRDDEVSGDGITEAQQEDIEQPPAPLPPGAVLVTEVRPFANTYDPNGDLHQDACDKFVELLATVPVDLSGAELLIKGKTAHVFGNLELAAGEALVLFSGSETCPKDYSGLPFRALASTKSFYSLLVVNPPVGGVAVRLLDTYGTTVDELVYVDGTAEWKTKFGLDKLSWDDIKALDCSFVREQELTPTSAVVPHPFSPVFQGTEESGTACKKQPCSMSPGTCAGGLPFPGCQ